MKSIVSSLKLQTREVDVLMFMDCTSSMSRWITEA
jgi:hypothetical protein